MTIHRWHVCSTLAELPSDVGPGRLLGDPPGDYDAWLRRERLIAGTPFLLSPDFEYDVVLNDFFQGVQMLASASSTQAGYARDIAAFLTFLWCARDRQSWRDANEVDHLAYLHWRRRDPDGPRVSGSTWNREVAAVNCFYRATLGKPPSVLAVAQKLGIPNTTFRRAFPEIAAELQLTRTSRPSQDPADINRFDQLKLDNAKLRADNNELSAHLHLAAANIQRLTLENHHLTQQLKAEAQITHLPARRVADQSGTRDHGPS